MVNDFQEDYDESIPKSTITIEEYMACPPAWKHSSSDVFLVFDNLSDARNCDINPWGFIVHIIPQLIEAEKRLKQGKFALIKSCGDWIPSFFIFETKENNIVYFSLLGFLPEPFNDYFPLKKSPQNIGNDLIRQDIELYDFVEANRAFLKPFPTHFDPNVRTIQNIELNYDELLKALIQQAELGKRFEKFQHKL